MTVPDHFSRRDSPPAGLPYDRGFHLAVLQGYLTPGEAIRRGSRRGLARKIARRHGLPLVLAFMVADNRLSLARALDRAREQAGTGPTGAIPAVREDARVVFAWLALGIVLGLSLALLWVGSAEVPAPVPVVRRSVPGPAEAPPTTSTVPGASRAAVRTTDDQGRLTRVVAGDPRGVLLAYCDGAPVDDPRWPIGIGPTLPPSIGTRLGILWRPNDWDASRRAIRIRKNPETGRWFAGDGESPIAIEEAPDYPQEVGILPVRTGGGPPPG